MVNREISDLSLSSCFLIDPTLYLFLIVINTITPK
nr:MAG TPA: hypothetical protein [Caudoviricetes sp.]